MPKLTIISKHAHDYAELVRDCQHLQLLCVTESAKGVSDEALQQADIAFADPALIGPVLPEFVSLRWLQSTWAGVRPLQKSAPSNLQITGVKGVFGRQMREYVFAYLLYFSRQIETFTRLQSQRHWHPPTPDRLYGKTLGILGVGEIGKDIAQCAKIFGMRVKGLNRSNFNCEHVDEFYSIKQLDTFAQDLDALVCLLPHTTYTEGLINRDFLSRLPPHCVLINGGRGQCIDDQALIQALHQHRLAAAVLDVFDTEPLPVDHPFWQTPNVYITQHCAAISKPQEIAGIFIENYLRYLQDAPLNYLIDLEKGY